MSHRYYWLLSVDRRYNYVFRSNLILYEKNVFDLDQLSQCVSFSTCFSILFHLLFLSVFVFLMQIIQVLVSSILLSWTRGK